jgi:hypothetical protein
MFPHFSLKQMFLALALGTFLAAALFVFMPPLELVGLLAGVLILLTNRDHPQRMFALIFLTFVALLAVSTFISPYNLYDGPRWNLDLWD